MEELKKPIFIPDRNTVLTHKRVDGEGNQMTVTYIGERDYHKGIRGRCTHTQEALLRLIEKFSINNPEVTTESPVKTT